MQGTVYNIYLMNILDIAINKTDFVKCKTRTLPQVNEISRVTTENKDLNPALFYYIPNILYPEST